jgi:hypothetical protein
MVIKRQKLAEMIAEEVRRRLRELAEAEDGPLKKKGKPRKPDTSSADQEEPPSGPGSTSPGATVGSPDVSQDAPHGTNPESDPDADSDGPSVDGSQPDPEAIDRNGDEGEDASGAVNNEISGKTVQSISIDPKSKVLPGAKAVIISFNESTDALQVLVTATGKVVFFWRGQLHDVP